MVYYCHVTGGTSIITLTVPATENYKEAKANISVTVGSGIIGGFVTITGRNMYGETLTANTDKVTPAGCTFTYKWYSNTTNSTEGGTLISSATSKTYTIEKGLVGKYIYVEVVASKAEYADATFKDITDAENNTYPTVAKAKLTKPSISGTYTYTGVEQTVSLANFDASTMSVTNNKRTNAGTQNVVVSLKDTANYEWADGTITDVTLSWTINKADRTISNRKSKLCHNRI